MHQSINQSRLLSYVRHGCPVARARGSCLKRKTIKLSMSKTIWNRLKEIESDWNIPIDLLRLKEESICFARIFLQGFISRARSAALANEEGFIYFKVGERTMFVCSYQLTIEKTSNRRVGSGRDKTPDPTRRLAAVSIVPSDRQPGTGRLVRMLPERNFMWRKVCYNCPSLCQPFIS